MNKIKLSKILAGVSALLAFIMIFINFASGLRCNASGFGMMDGQPSLFNLMHGGFEGFKENTNGIIHYLAPVSGLTVAFAFEIVATILFVFVLVTHFLGKQNSKIVALVSFLGVGFILASTILTFCTKAMTTSAVFNQLPVVQKDFTELMHSVFANNIKLGAGVIINGIFGILAIGSAVASRYMLRNSDNAQ